MQDEVPFGLIQGAITHRQQSEEGCVAACLAMLTGLTVEQVEAEIEIPCNSTVYYPFLVRRHILPKEHAEMLWGHLYMITVPSLNLHGHLHVVLLDLRCPDDKDARIIYDPNDGIEGRLVYTDAEHWHKDNLPWCEVVRMIDCAKR